jgi:putative FmdB family regulatory protein
MPIHDYRCLNKKCKKEFEVFYSSQSSVEREEPEEKCPECGSLKKEKLVSKSTSFILKGKGWAKDGYR